MANSQSVAKHRRRDAWGDLSANGAGSPVIRMPSNVAISGPFSSTGSRRSTGPAARLKESRISPPRPGATAWANPWLPRIAGSITMRRTFNPFRRCRKHHSCPSLDFSLLQRLPLRCWHITFPGPGRYWSNGPRQMDTNFCLVSVAGSEGHFGGENPGPKRSIT